jgi:hypothetical protein
MRVRPLLSNVGAAGGLVTALLTVVLPDQPRYLPATAYDRLRDCPGVGGHALGRARAGQHGLVAVW